MPVHKFSANLLKKPHIYICASYTYNEYLAWEGTFEPAFLLNIARLSSISNPCVTFSLTECLSRRAWTTSVPS